MWQKMTVHRVVLIVILILDDIPWPIIFASNDKAMPSGSLGGCHHWMPGFGVFWQQDGAAVTIKNCGSKRH